MRPRFEEALRVLRENAQTPKFPIELFLWNAALALIEAAEGEPQEARKHATAALEAVAKTYSRLNRHPQAGLVGARYGRARQELQKLLKA